MNRPASIGQRPSAIPQRPLGRTGVQVSVLGYGGAPIGFAEAGRAGDFVALLHQALDLGITFLDTARDYRDSEALLGRALAGRRAGVVLATKCGRVQTWTGAGWDVREDWSAAGIAGQIETSLRLLGTDYLDLVQLHSPPPQVLDDGAALHALVRAREAGHIRLIGVSADGAAAHQALALGVFDTLQISYSILQQEPGHDLLPAAAAAGLGVIAKQPVANGIPDLAERPGHPDWSWKWDVAQRMDWPALGAPAGRLDLALRWVLSNPQISTAIVGTTRPAHLAANARVAAAPLLEPAAWAAIQAAYTAARAPQPTEDPR